MGQGDVSFAGFCCGTFTGAPKEVRLNSSFEVFIFLLEWLKGRDKCSLVNVRAFHYVKVC